MTAFESGALNIPNPSATTLDEAIQQFNQNFQIVNNYCVNKRDVFFETITITNSNSGSTLVKTTKISIVKFTLTNAVLSVLLPTTNKDGDKFMIYDSEGLGATYNITINRNGNLINGASSNYVINQNKGWVELTYITNTGFVITNSSEIYNLLASNNTWSGTNDFASMTIGSSGTTSGLEIGNSNSSGGLSFLDFHFGISASEDYNVRMLNNSNQGFLFSTATKNIFSIDNSNFGFNVNAIPVADNTYSSGASGKRWTEIWASTGTINTSDREQKERVNETNLGLDFILKLKPVSWKWKDEPAQEIEEVKYKKTYDNKGRFKELVPEKNIKIIPEKKYKRLHHGFINQDIEDLLKEKNIATNDFSGFVLDKETGVRALRYDSFIAPIVKAVQEQQKMIQELKQEIKALKNAK